MYIFIYNTKIYIRIYCVYIYFFLSARCHAYLQVYSIRDAAANNLKRLAEEFGSEWAMQHIVPQVHIMTLWRELFSIRYGT